MSRTRRRGTSTALSPTELPAQPRLSRTVFPSSDDSSPMADCSAGRSSMAPSSGCSRVPHHQHVLGTAEHSVSRPRRPVLIARTQRVDAGLLREALSSEHRRRGIASDEPLQLPSATWREGYEKIANATPNYPPLDADDAVELVRRLVGPVLGGSVSGQWNPRTLEWDA